MHEAPLATTEYMHSRKQKIAATVLAPVVVAAAIAVAYKALGSNTAPQDILKTGTTTSSTPTPEATPSPTETPHPIAVDDSGLQPTEAAPPSTDASPAATR